MPYDSPDHKVKKSLKKDSFEGCILEGFDIFSLLNQLIDVCPEEAQKLAKY